MPIRKREKRAKNRWLKELEGVWDDMNTPIDPMTDYEDFEWDEDDACDHDEWDLEDEESYDPNDYYNPNDHWDDWNDWDDDAYPMLDVTPGTQIRHTDTNAIYLKLDTGVFANIQTGEVTKLYPCEHEYKIIYR